MSDELIKELAAVMLPQITDNDGLISDSEMEEASLDQARECLAKIDAMGMVIVPREPTPEMIEYGRLLDPLSCDVPEEDIPMVYGRIWEGMLYAVDKKQGKYR